MLDAFSRAEQVGGTAVGFMQQHMAENLAVENVDQWLVKSCMSTTQMRSPLKALVHTADEVQKALP